MWLCRADPDHRSVACHSHTFSSSHHVRPSHSRPRPDPSSRWSQTPSIGLSRSKNELDCLYSFSYQSPLSLFTFFISCHRHSIELNFVPSIFITFLDHVIPSGYYIRFQYIILLANTLAFYLSFVFLSCAENPFDASQAPRAFFTRAFSITCTCYRWLHEYKFQNPTTIPITSQRVLYSPPCIPGGIPRNPGDSGNSGGIEF